MKKFGLIIVLAVAFILLSEGNVAQTNSGWSKKKPQTAKSASKVSGHKSKSKPSGRGHSSAPSSVMSQQERDRIIQNLIANMVYVEGGTFTMGNTYLNTEWPNELEMPAHQVKLSSYYIGRYEVTQAEWMAVMGFNPSVNQTDLNLPVEHVSWNECQVFIKELNRLTKKRFRLPTEAEWEFAARGGNKSRGYTYAGSDNIDDVAWYYDNSHTTQYTFTHIVGKKLPNELGLYDMSGNVLEWCQSWYARYSANAEVNPKGPTKGKSRCLRGGQVNYSKSCCHVSYRGAQSPSYYTDEVGFRLAL